MKKKIVLVAVMGCAAAIWACSGDDSGTDGGGTDGGGKDATTESGGQDSGGQDSGGQDATGQDSSAQDSGGGDASDGGGAVNGCTTFTDMTADGGVITGPSGAVPSQYSPNCVHIKPGQSVTWNSNFTFHPLTASGGTTPSPITLTATGTTVTFTFPNAGTYGFECQIHTTSMFGAVEVQ